MHAIHVPLTFGVLPELCEIKRTAFQLSIAEICLTHRWLTSFYCSHKHMQRKAAVIWGKCSIIINGHRVAPSSSLCTTQAERPGVSSPQSQWMGKWWTQESFLHFAKSGLWRFSGVVCIAARNRGKDLTYKAFPRITGACAWTAGLW